MRFDRPLEEVKWRIVQKGHRCMETLEVNKEGCEGGSEDGEATRLI